MDFEIAVIIGRAVCPSEQREGNESWRRLDYTVDDLVAWLDPRTAGLEFWVERFGGEQVVTVCAGWHDRYEYFEGPTVLAALEAAVREVAS